MHYAAGIRNVWFNMLQFNFVKLLDDKFCFSFIHHVRQYSLSLYSQCCYHVLSWYAIMEINILINVQYFRWPVFTNGYTSLCFLLNMRNSFLNQMLTETVKLVVTVTQTMLYILTVRFICRRCIQIVNWQVGNCHHQ